MDNKVKPRCNLIGQDGNVFNLIGIASRTLKENGMRDEAKEMCDRVMSANSYGSALNIIGEYVTIAGSDDEEIDCDEEFNIKM
jgi:hypothetical protein